MFLTNDPWIGATHQSDVVLAAPVFVDGKLFCWVGQHAAPVGPRRHRAGRLQPDGARTCFWEAPCIPPVKVVEGGVAAPRHRGALPAQLAPAASWSRSTCAPQITGCPSPRDRIAGLVERYGAPTVKATMRKLQDDSETAFVRRLETIPDGTWTEEGWIEVKLPGRPRPLPQPRDADQARRHADLLQRRLGRRSRARSTPCFGAPGRARSSRMLALDDAVRPDVRARGRAAPLRVRGRARHDQLRDASGRGLRRARRRRCCSRSASAGW